MTINPLFPCVSVCQSVSLYACPSIRLPAVRLSFVRIYADDPANPNGPKGHTYTREPVMMCRLWGLWRHRLAHTQTDGQTDRWTDGQTSRRTSNETGTQAEKQTDKRTEGQMHRRTDDQTDAQADRHRRTDEQRQTEKRADGQTDRPTDRQTNKRTDKQMDRRTEGQIRNSCISANNLY